MGRCQRLTELWADTCEVSKSFVFLATTVQAEWGRSFAYTMHCSMQVRLDRIDSFHTLQPYLSSADLQLWITCDTVAASLLCRRLVTKTVHCSFMACRMLTLAACFKIHLFRALCQSNNTTIYCFLHCLVCLFLGAMQTWGIPWQPGLGSREGSHCHCKAATVTQ